MTERLTEVLLMASFPLDVLGGRPLGGTGVAFGVLLPWVSPDNGQEVHVLVIHEADQFLQDIPVVDVALRHSIDGDYGDMWSVQIDFATATGLPVGAHWGSPGRYVYRFVVVDPRRGRVDWIIDPCARDFGVGKQSAVVVPEVSHAWSGAEATWRTPELRDLVMYEVNLAELYHDIDGATDRLAYLADLGVNCISVMPVCNVAVEVDWGYLPVGYFGVDERFGGNDAFKRFVDSAHQRGVAVIVDAVYGHASRAQFAYSYLYDALGYDNNPFMGDFAQNLFDDEGRSVDHARPLVRAFYRAVSQHWLTEFHIDGFRYDCVPNYWDGVLGVGYPSLVYETHEWVTKQVADGNLARFSGSGALIQCAEQLEHPVDVLWQSYSDTTWQNGTLDAARGVARGADGAINWFGRAIGLDGFPTEVPLNGEVFPRTALQYIENHDHSRFLAQFGTVQPDEAGNYLFAAADRSHWYKVQPYLIALLTAKGTPLLFEGQELAEDFTLPGNGLGRVALLRPVDWDYFYDDYGRPLVRLVRKLLALRNRRSELRGGDHFFYDDAGRYQNQGVMVFRRTTASSAAVVAVNFTATDAVVPFVFPSAGDWVEELHGQDNLTLSAGQTVELAVPSNYGRIWTLG